MILLRQVHLKLILSKEKPYNMKLMEPFLYCMKVYEEMYTDMKIVIHNVNRDIMTANSAIDSSFLITVLVNIFFNIFRIPNESLM